MQAPPPPIYAACSKPDSAVDVGALGIGALNFAVGNDEYLARKVSAYKQAVAAATPSNFQKTDHFASTPVALCLDDDRKACAYGMRGARFFAESLAIYYFGGKRPTGLLPVNRDFLDDEELAEAMAFRGAEDAPAMSVVGDPVHCKEIVSRFADAGVDELILVMQAGTVPYELVIESIRTFGEKVMPDFA